MTWFRKIIAIVLALLHITMVSLLVHLAFFAAKGPRYTADDGAREQAERIASDQALAARIDLLHNLLAEQEGHHAVQAQ